MIGTIFNNNIKTISRNWNYFLVLVIFPIILILLAGTMLNSANLNNIRVGLVNEGETVSLDFSGKVQNIFPHASLSDCLSMMAEGERMICIRVYTVNELPMMDAYLDNTKKVMESYAKQFFLETILDKQNIVSAEGAESFNSKISVFTSSFSSARQELDKSYQELDNQEKNLLQYQSEVIGTLAVIPNSSANTLLLLTKMNQNLSESIIKTQKGKQKILELQNSTVNGEKQLMSIKNSVRDKEIIYKIKSAFENSPKSPVALAFPLLIALIITFTSVVLSNIFVSRQTNQPNYIRTLVAPVKDSSFLFADYAVNLFFMSIQAVFILLVGIYFFEIDIISSLPQILLVIFLSSSIFIFIGMAFGYFFKSENLSMLLSIFIVLLFQIFSDLLAPTALVGPLVGFFVSINPFVILSELLGEIILLRSPLNVLVSEIMKLILLFLVTLGIMMVAKKMSKNRTLY